MILFKVIFGALLCCPMAYIAVAIFTSLVDDASKQK